MLTSLLTIAVEIEARRDGGVRAIEDAASARDEEGVRELIDAGTIGNRRIGGDAGVDQMVRRIAIGLRASRFLNAGHPCWANAFIPRRDAKVALFIGIGIAVLIGVDGAELEDGGGIRLAVLVAVRAIIILPITAELGRAWIGLRIVIVTIFGSAIPIGRNEARRATTRALFCHAETNPVLAGRRIRIVAGASVAWMSIAVGIAPAEGDVGIDGFGDAGFLRIGCGRVASIKGARLAPITIERLEGDGTELTEACVDTALFTVARVAVLTIGIGSTGEPTVVLTAIAFGGVLIIAFFAERDVHVAVAANRWRALTFEADGVITTGSSVRAILAGMGIVERARIGRITRIGFSSRRLSAGAHEERRSEHESWKSKAIHR